MSSRKFSNATTWVIHACKKKDAAAIFLKKNQIALSWDLAGDISVIPAHRDEFQGKNGSSITGNLLL